MKSSPLLSNSFTLCLSRQLLQWFARFQTLAVSKKSAKTYVYLIRFLLFIWLLATVVWLLSFFPFSSQLWMFRFLLSILTTYCPQCYHFTFVRACHPTSPYFLRPQRPDFLLSSLFDISAASILLISTTSSFLPSDCPSLPLSLASIPSRPVPVSPTTRPTHSQPSPGRDRPVLLRFPVRPPRPAGFPPSTLPLGMSSVSLASASFELPLLGDRPWASFMEPEFLRISMESITSDAQPLPPPSFLSSLQVHALAALPCLCNHAD